MILKAKTDKRTQIKRIQQRNIFENLETSYLQHNSEHHTLVQYNTVFKVGSWESSELVATFCTTLKTILYLYELYY